MDVGEQNLMWARLIVEELVRLGVRCFCLAPGSRCTPLTVAVAMHPEIEPVQHYDERGLAFFALGHARASGRPAAFICTSGTAVANTMPAVVEAAEDGVPLILLTADRPPELRDTHANQTVDQIGMLRGYLRWQVDLPCPTAEISAAALLTTIDQAWRQALSAKPGPVQINCMYRKPFLPEELPGALSGPWVDAQSPFRQQTPPCPRVDDAVLTLAVKRLDAARRPLLLVGGLAGPREVEAAGELMRRLRWPAMVDICSGLRLRAPDACCLVHAEALSPELLAETDLVLQLGGRFVGKGVERLLSREPSLPTVRLQAHPERDDPYHRPGLVLEGDLADTCRRLAEQCAAQPEPSWLERLVAAHQEVAERLPELQGEAAMAVAIARDLQADEGLFLAASLPIRDFNTFAPGDGAGGRVGANRGASGIDGTVASAAGFAHGTGQLLTLVIGDLALLHDLNSLPLLAAAGAGMRVIVFNNGGGGIFSLLPIAEHRALHHRYFYTPHNWGFKDAAGMYGIPYVLAEDLHDLTAALAESRELGVCLIEARTGSDDYSRALQTLRGG